MKPAPFSNISVVDKICRFAKILKDFPSVTGVIPPKKIEASEVVHHILTTGPPISERTRRLAPEKLPVAKAYIGGLQKEGKCQPSSASWASPLHMAPKKGAGGGCVAIIAD